MTDMKEFETILRKYQENMPLNITALANELKIGVFGSPMINPAISGKLIKADRPEYRKYDMGSGWFIIVNRMRPAMQVKVTVAYLVAKYILTDISGLSVVSDSARYRTKALLNHEDEQVNRLVLEMLVPDFQLRKALDNGLYIHELGSYFGVSEATMSAKLGFTVYPIDYWVNDSE